MTSHESSPATDNPLASEAIGSAEYIAQIARSLEECQDIGFDFAGSIRHGAAVSSEIDIADRQREIVHTAVQLAEAARLDTSFFERPVNTMLLTAVADSWIDNEMLTTGPETAESVAKTAAEKAMLEDTLLIVAGSTSGVAQDMILQDPKRADRYAESGYRDPEIVARDAFFESIDDSVLAAEVQTILEQRGPGSFLEAQRSAMALEVQDEQKFTVQVLKLGSRFGLENAGALQAVQWPDFDFDASPEERARMRPYWDAANEHNDANTAFAEPYEAAYKEYLDRFGDEFGDLADAFVAHHNDGRIIMTLKAEQAYALVNYYGGKMPYPEDEQKRDMVIRDLHVVQHEFTHTQKKLTIGNHIQMNLLYEERKAEGLSGDRHGYADVKGLFKDVEMASEVPLYTNLTEALKDKDAASSLMARNASSLGLRTALLLAISKPVPYDRNPKHAEQFVNAGHLVIAEDASPLDMVVRDILTRKGDARMKANAATYVANMLDSLQGSEFIASDFKSDPTLFVGGLFIPMRRQEGLGLSADYLSAALKERTADAS